MGFYVITIYYEIRAFHIFHIRGGLKGDRKDYEREMAAKKALLLAAKEKKSSGVKYSDCKESHEPM